MVDLHLKGQIKDLQMFLDLQCFDLEFIDFSMM